MNGTLNIIWMLAFRSRLSALAADSSVLDTTYENTGPEMEEHLRAHSENMISSSMPTRRKRRWHERFREPAKLTLAPE